MAWICVYSFALISFATCKRNSKIYVAVARTNQQKKKKRRRKNQKLTDQLVIPRKHLAASSLFAKCERTSTLLNHNSVFPALFIRYLGGGSGTKYLAFAVIIIILLLSLIFRIVVNEGKEEKQNAFAIIHRSIENDIRNNHNEQGANYFFFNGT